ncbi:MAG: IMPACT family protein [Methylophilaceae bacterium]
MQRIIHSGIAEQTITKSRFIAMAEYCADERDVMLLLRRLATEHAHAHHLVFAYQLQNPQGGVLQRFHDAGEPSGTAGKPILQYIEGRDLLNACVAVVRYYGGINLGTGGLARAYGGTAKMALEAATISAYIEMGELRLNIDYKQLDGLMRDIAKLGGEIKDKQFGEGVSVVVSLPKSEMVGLRQRYF